MKCWNGFCIASDCDGIHHVDATGDTWSQGQSRVRCDECARHQPRARCRMTAVDHNGVTDYVRTCEGCVERAHDEALRDDRARNIREHNIQAMELRNRIVAHCQDSARARAMSPILADDQRLVMLLAAERSILRRLRRVSRPRPHDHFLQDLLRRVGGSYQATADKPLRAWEKRHNTVMTRLRMTEEAIHATRKRLDVERERETRRERVPFSWSRYDIDNEPYGDIG